MKQFKTKKKRKYFGFYFFFIFLETVFLIQFLGGKISPKLINVAKNNINFYNNRLVEEYVDTKSLTTNLVDELITLIMKNNQEIVGINYNVGKGYQVLRQIKQDLRDASLEKSYSEFDTYANNVKGKMVLKYPIGLASNNLLINGLGYKVPIQLDLNHNILTSLKTKVTNYGINNALVEMYLSISFQSNIVYFSLDEILKNSYEILLASKMVMGNVPSYLNGYLEENTTIN